MSEPQLSDVIDLAQKIGESVAMDLADRDGQLVAQAFGLLAATTLAIGAKVMAPGVAETQLENLIGMMRGEFVLANAGADQAFNSPILTQV